MPAGSTALTRPSPVGRSLTDETPSVGFRAAVADDQLALAATGPNV